MLGRRAVGSCKRGRRPLRARPSSPSVPAVRDRQADVTWSWQTRCCRRCDVTRGNPTPDAPSLASFTKHLGPSLPTWRTHLSDRCFAPSPPPLDLRGPQAWGDGGGAMRWWRRLAKAGDTMAAFKMGMAHYDGAHGGARGRSRGLPCLLVTEARAAHLLRVKHHDG